MHLRSIAMGCLRTIAHCRRPYRFVRDAHPPKWYVAIPLYSLVLLEGFTLTGNNSQSFCDVIGGLDGPRRRHCCGCTSDRRLNLTAGAFSQSPRGSSTIDPRGTHFSSVGMGLSYS